MFEELIEQVCKVDLDEGIASARKAFLDTGKVDQEKFDFFANADPSKNKKYLDWMIAQYIEDPSRPEHIRDVIRIFDQQVKRNIIDQKDINQYKTWQEVEQATTEAGKKKTRSQQREEIKGNAEKIVDNDQVTIVVPKDFEASKLYGKGTKWCTTMHGGQYWDDYTSRGVKFYYIMDKVNNTKYAVAVYLSGEKEVYDAEDRNISFDELERRIGKMV